MYTIDTETYLIGPGKLAPPPVCLQFAHGDGDVGVAVCGVDPVRDLADAILDDELIVGANIAYDFLVLGRAYPELMPGIFKAYAEDRILDVQVREKLKRIADGSYFRLRGMGFSLGVLSERYGIVKDAKDPWRLRYQELWGIPFENWPRAAQDYALHDVEATRWVYYSQANAVGARNRGKNLRRLFLHGNTDWGVSPDESHQARAAWMLHLTTDAGVMTDPAAIKTFEAAERKAFEEDRDVLRGTGLVRADGTRNLAAARASMVVAMGRLELPVPQTKKKMVCLDEEACNSSGDAILQAYQRYASRQNLLTRIQALKFGVTTPINPGFDSLMETGRTSCFSGKGEIGEATHGYQVQNMRRVAGERECFVPRKRKEPGKRNVFIAVDFDTVEMVTLAQCCLWALGESELAKVLNAGGDPHLSLAAEMLGRDEREVQGIYADLNHPDRKAIKKARQICKVANFGFPGSMSHKTFCAYAQGFGIKISPTDAQILQQNWFSRWREMESYFYWIKNQWLWTSVKRGGFDMRVADIRQFVSQRKRAQVTYTAACNGFFQGLAADLAKAAGFALQLECEIGQLQGWRPWNFVHDEFLNEGPQEDGARAAPIIVDTMVSAGQKWVPDVKLNAAAAMMYRWTKDAEPVYRDGQLIPWEDRRLAA
jgi:DNA polymerase family A